MGTNDDPPILSVADLDRSLKRAVESAAGDVWVEGEVSGAKPAASGHVYFSLKDEREDASIECVMYRSASLRSRQLLSNGARVQLRGRATLWAPRGRLQFTAEQARPAGRGALLEALEALKAKLASEGLFAPDRKRPLPVDARVIGVVTSRSGAVIHDIAKVAFRRGNVRILLSPALVQGQGAALQLIDAIERLEQVGAVDVIVIGRGGGSADDLMVFNEEAVVRRVARCRIPVVSAIGHEVDVTLTDLVADARAATPSQAAELLVADAETRARILRQMTARLHRAMRARVVEDRSVLSHLRTSFGAFRLASLERSQAVDEATRSLERSILRSVGRSRSRLERVRERLFARHPQAVVSRCSADLAPMRVRLEAAVRDRIEVARSALAANAGRLEAMSPLNVLARGYAIVTAEGGRIVRSTVDICEGQLLTVRVHRGTLATRVESRTVPVEPAHGERIPVTEAS